MKALNWYGREDIHYEEVPEPSPGPGQVKIKVHVTGICGSDLHEYQAGPVFISREPNPITGKSIPVILGHEFAGTVVEVGEGISKFSVGDRVTGDCVWACGECYYCMRNMPNMCPSSAYTGFHTDGSMADYVVLTEDATYKIPDSISDEVGALLEPLEVGVHAVRRANLLIGDTVAILGAGTIGICTLLAARAAGASKVFMVEISKHRAEVALSFGANAIINPKECDAVKQICSLTDGLGADVSFDCVGNKVSGPIALGLVRRRGTTVIVGMSPLPSPDFNFLSLQMTEKTVLGSLAYCHEIPFVIDLIASGRMNPSGLVTARVPLKDGVRKGFDELINNPDKHLKILLEP